MPQYLPLGQVTAPAQWTIPPDLNLGVEAVFASFDGSGAAGAYIPTLEIVSDGGRTVVEVPQDASVAAGSSVVASWAPFLRSATTGGGGGGVTVQQGVYNAPNQSVGSGGSFGDAAWTYVAGDAVLDLTSPALPAAVATGLYIFNISFAVNGGGTVGRTFQGNIQLNTTFPRNQVCEIANPSGGFGITGHTSDAAVITVGQTFRFRLVNNDSINHNMNISEAHVAFIPT